MRITHCERCGCEVSRPKGWTGKTFCGTCQQLMDLIERAKTQRDESERLQAIDALIANEGPVSSRLFGQDAGIVTIYTATVATAHRLHNLLVGGVKPEEET